MLQDAAESNLSTAGVGGTTRCGSRRLLSSRAVAAPDVHGRALRQEKGDDRRFVVDCCLVQRGPAASPDLEELVEAAPVAAQVAPHRRQVAAARREGDVLHLGAGRNAAEMKFLSSLDLYVLSSLQVQVCYLWKLY